MLFYQAEFRKLILVGLLLCWYSFVPIVRGQFSTTWNLPPDSDFGENRRVTSDTQLNLSDGGSIGDSFNAGFSGLNGNSSNVEVNISGGSVGSGFTALNGSTVNIAGGTFGDAFDARFGSSVIIYGGEFKLDGVPIIGLDTVGSSLQLDVPSGSLLTGTFASGTPFAFINEFEGDKFFSGSLTLQATVLPMIGPSVVTAPADPIPLGIRSGQTLLVGTGGMVPDSFNSGVGSSVNVAGGQLGTNFEAVGSTIDVSGGIVGDGFDAFRGSNVSISGGVVGEEFDAYEGSTVNILGGVIGENFDANRGSAVNILGGDVGDFFDTYDTSVVNISGGSVGSNANAFFGSTVNLQGGSIGANFDALGGSVINVSGGTLGERFNARSNSELNISGGAIGDQFRAYGGSRIKLIGADFRLDGAPISGLEMVGNTQSISVPSGSLLSGTLSDGTPFAFSAIDFDSFASGSLTLEVAELPSDTSSVITVPNDLAPLGVRDTQTLILNQGGELSDNFNAGIGSTVQINGGNVGNNFEAVGAQITISGGVIGNEFDAFHGTTLDISGGDIGDELVAASGSTVNVFGGTIGRRFISQSGSVVNIAGGEIQAEFDAQSGSVVNVSGGSLGSSFDALSGSTVIISGGTLGDDFDASSGSSVVLAGGDFQLDGAPINGLGSIGDIVNFEVPSGSLLTGTLSDGTPVAFTSLDFDSFASNTLTLEAATVAPIGQPLITTPNQAVPLGIRSGQTLVVDPGGIVPDNFNAGVGSTVQINGGLVGANLEAVGAHVTINDGVVGDDFDAFSGSVVDITGGAIGQGFNASTNSTVNISGGTVGSGFDANAGSVVNISGGEVDFLLEANSGSTVNVSGGSIGARMRANDGSIVNISGGSIGNDFYVFDGSQVDISGGSIGDYFQARDGSNVNISGGTISWNFDSFANSSVKLTGNDFRLNGVPVAGLDNFGDSSTLNLPGQFLLTGTLEDGTPFAFSYLDGDSFATGSLTLEAAELPALGQTTIIVPTDPVPLGVRNGQQLVVNSGGMLPDNFNAGLGSTIQIAGGSVGRNFEAVGANVTISGGAVGGVFDAFEGTTVNISGGSVGLGFNAQSGSIVNISGGTIDDNFDAKEGSTVTIVGSEFRLNGVPIDGLENVGDTLPIGLASIFSVDVLSGTLADGTPFVFSYFNLDRFDAGTLTLQAAALPPISQTVITTPADEVAFGVRGGQTLIINQGGVIPDNFNAGLNSTIVVNDGALGRNLEAIGAVVVVNGGMINDQFDAFSGTTVYVNGGEIGNEFDAFSGSVIHIAGGQIGRFFDAKGGTVNISGGSIGDDSRARTGSVLNISGGSIGEDFEARNGSIINVSGGVVGENFEAEGGSVVNISGGVIGDRFEAHDDSTINLFGTRFILDGLDITNTLEVDLPFTILDRDVTLEGLFADGTPFSFDLNDFNFISEDYFDLNSLLTVTLTKPGDFNGDGLVNGSDFLTWQRGESPSPLSSFDLAAWQTHYGADVTPLAISSFVPEPSTCLLAAFSILGIVCHRKAK